MAGTLGYERPEWSLPRGAPSGWIDAIGVESRGLRRDARASGSTCLPATTRRGPTRWWSCTTATTSSTYADLPVVLDNLIDEGAIPPVIVALVQTRDRLGEYSGSRAHAQFLVHELLPALAGALADLARNRRTGCCWGRASARSRRSPPPSAIPACSAGWC